MKHTYNVQGPKALVDTLAQDLKLSIEDEFPTAPGQRDVNVQCDDATSDRLTFRCEELALVCSLV